MTVERWDGHPCPPGGLPDMEGALEHVLLILEKPTETLKLHVGNHDRELPRTQHKQYTVCLEPAKSLKVDLYDPLKRPSRPSFDGPLLEEKNGPRDGHGTRSTGAVKLSRRQRAAALIRTGDQMTQGFGAVSLAKPNDLFFPLVLFLKIGSELQYRVNHLEISSDQSKDTAGIETPGSTSSVHCAGLKSQKEVPVRFGAGSSHTMGIPGST
ncbi:hypothetical protein DFH07DRAFT_784903 [Mycena maculata]|uniref:Uncharacterized protein n=1 Tax=Mycena maculata TaxID=230809 RepID=A0AAD7MI75_9AGAR|nr:hypothetical protein DFH07DRAFT_784903 [Mycena maculata]